MKPLTQSEIDATGLLDGWTVDDMYETLIDPTGFRFKGCVKTAITRLVRTCLANRLEAAPQPPVEQSEPKSGVWIAGQWREIREGGFCPKCSHKPGDCIAGTCAWQCFHVSLGAPQARTHIWLAPPAVIEPEPELDEFEAWVTDVMGDNSLTDGVIDTYGQVLEKYRDIISRKGDK